MNDITDTERLNWILKHVEVLGDDNKTGVIPAVWFNAGTMEDKLENRCLMEQYDLEKKVKCGLSNGWEIRVILAGIDEAIRREREE